MSYRHRGPGRSGRERSDRLSRTSGAELPRDRRDEHHDERDRDRRDDAQPARRLAEQRLREAPDQRRQRRLVVVPPGWVLRGDAEVQLVAVVTVAVRRGEEQQQFAGRDREDKRPRDGRPTMRHDGLNVARVRLVRLREGLAATAPSALSWRRPRLSCPGGYFEAIF